MALMMEDGALELFAHFARRPEQELDLARATLLIAEPEYPGIDIARYVGMLDDFGEGARKVARGQLPAEAAQSVLSFVYDELRFQGNTDDYYDPRNSFLNEVIDRRTGIPITLGVVLLEICDRAGVGARGISFPGHFLLRLELEDGILVVDPYEGRLLSPEQLQRLYQRVTGTPGSVSPQFLMPAKKSDILLRMLNNLRGIYVSRSDSARLRDVLERIHMLSPTEEVRAQLSSLDRLDKGPEGSGN